MNLKHWLISNHERIFNSSSIKDLAHLHVVGTCGTCRHWEPSADKYGECHFETRWCEKYEEDQTCTEWESDSDTYRYEEWVTLNK